MPFESFPNFFLKLKLVNIDKSDDGQERITKIDATGKDYYQILGVDGKYVGQSVKRTSTNKRVKKERNISEDDNGARLEADTIEAYLTKLRGQNKNVRRDGLVIVEVYWEDESEFGENPTFSAIRKAYKIKSLRDHSDKGGSGFQLVNEAYNVLSDHEHKTKYDQYYQDLINDTADNNFKQRVRSRLKELSRKMEEVGGNVNETGGASNDGGVKGVDISAYTHLFPTDKYISETLNKAKTKPGISRWANWVIYTYYQLLPLQDELDGNDRAVYNKNKPAIDAAKLGSYANFKSNIWNHKSLDEVNDYVARVRTKIKLVALGKNAPKGNYAYEDAWNENLAILRNLDGWDELSGPENQQATEKFHFVMGYRDGEKGICLYTINDSNNYYYQAIIKNCQTFIKIKKLIKEKLAELNDLYNAEGGNIQGNAIGPIERELKSLGELKEIKHYSNGKSYSGSGVVDYTEMKFKDASSSELKSKIANCFRELRAEISKKGSKPRNSGGGGGGGSNNPKQEAIREIKNALKETGLTAEELRLDKVTDGILTGWENLFNHGKWGHSTDDINSWKNECLNVIYRVSARRKLVQKLAVASISEKTILGSGKTLKEHFKSFQGKSAIHAEFLRLVNLIDNQGQDNDQEIKSAIGAVKNTLRANDLEQDQAKIEIILGKNWEGQFQGLDKNSIEKLRDNFIKKITDFVAKDKDAARAIIQEIEKALQAASLPESILGENWKAKFEGKNETEINAERERLLKLIENEINKQENEGKISSEDSKNKKETIVKNRKEQSKKVIDKKLKEGHQKLTVKPDELPISLFVPYKSLEEKLNSLEGLEEISAFNDKLLVAINDKKNEKLEVIVNEAIGEIEQEIGGLNIELGKNKDFKEKIKNSRDPDVIEMIKQNVLQLVKEQKLAAALISDISSSQGDQPEKPGISWPKKIGIAILIVSPLMVIVFIILRARRRKLERKKWVK